MLTKDIRSLQINNAKRPQKNASLDTLGQPPTDWKGNLKKRARSKFYTKSIVGKLLYINSPLHHYYQSAYYCGEYIEQIGTELRTRKYCDTRICHVCNRIRTAHLMNGYISQLEGKKGLQFVTLTIPNVKDYQLKESIEKMSKSFSNILRVLRERRGIECNGIRKIEVTYNPSRNDYHPHIHAIVDKEGKQIIEEWLKRFPEASINAQDCRNADQGSLNELFKYQTKITAKTGKGEMTFYVNAIDIIMQALYKKRSFQPFGNIRKVKEEIEEELHVQECNGIEPDYCYWIWNDNASDWLNIHTGELLTGYNPPDIVLKFHLSPSS